MKFNGDKLARAIKDISVSGMRIDEDFWKLSRGSLGGRVHGNDVACHSAYCINVT
jgi:hypothetical protein